MEEGSSFNNDIGSVLIKEYNDMLREIQHLDEKQLLEGVDQQMQHAVDENKILTSDQAVLMQCELNTIKIQLDKLHLLQHVCRDMDQRSLKSNDAIGELDLVIQRKENIVATMRKIIGQTVKLFNGREKILEEIKMRNEQLQQQHVSLDRKRRSIRDQFEYSASVMNAGSEIINVIQSMLHDIFQDDVRFELKSFTDLIIYFDIFIRVEKSATTVDENNPAQIQNTNYNNNTAINSNRRVNAEGGEWCDIPLKCVLINDPDDGCYRLSYVFFGPNERFDPEKVISTPFPIPMLVDLIGKYQRNRDNNN